MQSEHSLIKLSPSDPRWIHLLQTSPDASIFHHPAWLETLAAGYGFRGFIFGVTDRKGQLQVGIPFAETRRLFSKRRWISLPFSDFCYPLSLSEAAGKELTSMLCDHAATKGIQVEIRHPANCPGFHEYYGQYVRHTIALDGGIEKTAKGISRQQMQNIHVAEKNGITLVRGNGLKEVSEFYRLHTLTRRKHGVPVQPWGFFRLLTLNLLRKDLGFVLLAYRDDQCISAGVFLHWNKMLTYKYSASDETSLNLRPNHLVTWQALQWGCENNYGLFDFGRSEVRDEGLCSFKRRWGAAENALSYSFTNPASIPSGAQNNRMVELAGEVIRRSPVWVCRAAGEIAYRFME